MEEPLLAPLPKVASTLVAPDEPVSDDSSSTVVFMTLLNRRMDRGHRCGDGRFLIAGVGSLRAAGHGVADRWPICLMRSSKRTDGRSCLSKGAARAGMASFRLLGLSAACIVKGTGTSYIRASVGLDLSGFWGLVATSR